MADLELIYTNLKRYTFESPKIKEWAETQCKGLVLNLFAGKTKLNVNEIRNDLDELMPADSHIDAFEFIEVWEEISDIKFDTVLLDPPYSYRKSMEMYKGNRNSRFKLIADNIHRITVGFPRIVTFGYHSTFMGSKRGFHLSKLCVFAHGGAQHCTIGIVEERNLPRRIRGDKP